MTLIDIDAAQMGENFGSVCGMITRGDVARLTFRGEKIVMMSERAYDEMLRAARNAEYIAEIEKAFEDVERGGGNRPVDRGAAGDGGVNITFSPLAWKQYIEWQSSDAATFKKINALIEDIRQNGQAIDIGHPEPLKGCKAWSRRIDHEHRLVYRTDGENIIIARCKGHYED